MTAEGGSAAQAPAHTLVLYDGVCGLCNRLVAFLLRHDRRDEFRFAPLQSDTAQALLPRHGLHPNDLDTVVVLMDYGQPTERALTRSLAALAVTRRLGGVWNIFAVANIAPLPLREALYKFVARRRYRIFGRYDQCPLPRLEDRQKFLSSAL